MGKRKSILKILQDFKSRTSYDFPISKMYLFGSRARGKSNRWSDIDLVIVSDKFKKLNFRKRAIKMYDYWNFDYPVDFLCYTTEEFNKLKNQLGVIKEAVDTGIEI